MKKLLIKYREIWTYLITGVAATAISWGSYPLLLRLFNLLLGQNNTVHLVKDININVFLASLLSWTCAFCFAFVTNKLWVFESKSWEKKTALKEFFGFLAARAFTGIFEVLFVPLFVSLGIDAFFQSILQKLHIHIGVLFESGMCSKIVASVIVVVLNYVFSKLFVFKKSEQAQDSRN